MKTKHSLCFLASLVCAAVPAYASDDDVSSPFYAYQQRYGAGFAPLPPAPPKETVVASAAPPVSAPAPTLTSYPSYAQGADLSVPPSAYAQHYETTSPYASAASSTDKRAELNISTIYDNDPASDVNGGSSYGLETTAYSATIDKKWRLFAGELFSHELEPEGEGHINYSRSMAGFEYDNRTVRTSFAPTYNLYNGNERVGAAGDATWTINDRWAVGGGAQLFSRDVPLRALDAGITANSYDAMADFYQQDIRDVRLNGEVMTFSDGNTRSSVSAGDTEHLYVGKHFTFDGLGTLVESQNSDDESRPYFNPAQDVLGMIGGRLGQPLYSSYGIAYDHSIEVKPGIYWQRNYGGSPAVTATYAQHLNYRDDIDASVAVNFTREDSDGTPENDLAVSLNLSKKF